MIQKLTMTRGDTASFGLQTMLDDGTGYDLETAFFSVRAGFDGALVFQKSLGDGITKRDEGIYSVRIAPEDTQHIPAGQYYYDLEIGANSDVFTVLRGILQIEHDVTY